MNAPKIGTKIVNAISVCFLVAVVVVIGVAWTKNNSDIDRQKEQVVANTEKNSRFADIQLEISSGKAILLDVRTPAEYREGFYPEAVNLSLAQLESGQLPDVEKTQTIYVYCRSGNRSQQATKLLKQAEYVSIVDLGGIDEVASIGGILTKESSKFSKQASAVQELLIQEKMISDVMTKLSQVHNTTEYEELIAQSRLHQSKLSQILRQRDIKDRRSSLVGTFSNTKLQERYDTYIKSGQASSTAARAVVTSALEEYTKAIEKAGRSFDDTELDAVAAEIRAYLKAGINKLNSTQKSNKN